MCGMGSSLWVSTYGAGAELFLEGRELDAQLRRARHERTAAFWSRMADAVGQWWSRSRGRGDRIQR